MNFKDDFEHKASDDLVYLVKVEGFQTEEDGRTYTDIEFIEITDELGEVIDETHEFYFEIKEEAEDREYNVEHHGTDFSYYDETLDGLLGE